MILYIAKRSEYDIGSKTHLQALKDIYGENQIFIIDLLNEKVIRNEQYISFGKYKGIKERVERWFQGNVVFIDNKIINSIVEIIIRYNVSFVFSEESDLGNLVKKIKKTKPDCYIVCFYHDISADLFAQRRRQATWKKIHYKLLDCNITIHQEKINQKYCDENWVFHKYDEEKFVYFYGYKPNSMIPLSCPIPVIDENIKKIVTSAKSHKKILFVCSSYYVNKIGFQWFYNHVLPNLYFDFQIDVIGTGSKGLADFCFDPRVNLLGPVKYLNQYYLDADIVITPIFDGGGMKVKTLEAVSYAKCIIGSSESLHGYWEEMPDSVKEKIVFQCDTANEWIDSLTQLATQDVKKFNKELYEVFINHFSYETMLKLFQNELNRINGSQDENKNQFNH